MSINIRAGHLPHIFWIDLGNDGVFVECAVMNRDKLGNITFIRINSLDAVDRRRLLRIVTNRNARTLPLWDVMSSITLANGVNALQYFHQLVEVITQTGRIMRPQSGVLGTGMIDTGKKTTRKRAAAEEVGEVG
jgi:hypothetical protein